MNKLNLPFTVYEERCIAIYFEVSRPFIFIRDLNKTAYPNEGRNLTCSNYATSKRKFGEKIVTYTYFEHTAIDDIEKLKGRNRYFEQISARAKEVGGLYPGWQMRLYLDLGIFTFLPTSLFSCNWIC